MRKPEESRVFIIAPVGQDAEAMAGVLWGQEIRGEVCGQPAECLKRIETGAAALVLTEEALEMPGADRLLAHLRAQAAWSELPVIILTSGGESRLLGLLELATSAAGSVTLLERPMSPGTLLRSVQVALRTRQRQYQVRDLMVEQERQRRELQESEEQFRAMFNVASVGKAQADPTTGRLLRVNAALCRMTGYTEAELLGSNLRDLTHPEDREADWASFCGMTRGETGGYEREKRYVRADRQVIWVHVSANVIRDGAGRPMRATAIIQDITKRKKAEAALRKDLEALTRMHELSLRRLEAGGLETLLQQIMEAAVAIVGAEKGTLQLLEEDSLRIVAQHGQGREFLDYFAAAETRASVCGMAMRRGERVLVPDVETSPLFAGTPSLEVLLGAGIRAVQSTPIMSRGGALLGMLSTHWSRPYSPDEHDLWRIDLLTRQAADLIEEARAEAVLRESEERFRSLADGTPVLIWVHDVTGGLRFVNRAWSEFFGKTLDQASGENWKPLVHAEDVSGYVDEFLRCHAERREFHAQARVRRHDGKWRWLESFAAARFSATGEYLGMAGSSADITRRKEAEAVLARGKEELERLVAERTAKLQDLVGELEHFSYSITHDMRAPLRAMMAFAHVLEDMCADSPNQEQKDLVGRIGIAAKRMDLLITDALSYSKAVRSELPLAPVDLGRLLRGMVDTYPELQDARRGISVQRDLPLVMGNEAGLTQCFSNLLGNAVKFVKPGESPEIRVRAEVLKDGDHSQCKGERVRIWVEDRGIGISKTMLPKIFNMFARGGSGQAGTGIGLALVRKVVDRMGGRVGVESVQGEGSRFWVELAPGDVRQYGMQIRMSNEEPSFHQDSAPLTRGVPKHSVR